MARFQVVLPYGADMTFEGEYRIRGGSLAIHPTTEDRIVYSPAGWLAVRVLEGDSLNLFNSMAR